MPILVVVEDLFFLSRIRETADHVNASIEAIGPSELSERLAASLVPAVVCDLNDRAGLALEAIRAMKQNQAFRHIPVLGFLSHVQAGLAREARDAGCDVVMARSAFSQQLPQILSKYAAGDASPAALPRRDHAE